MALVVLDASAVIGFLDPGDSLHPACVAGLRSHQHDDLVLPASAYAEILVGPFRAGAEAVAAIDAFLADFSVTVAPLTPLRARTAARLRSGHRSLRLPDALVLATAEELEAEVVLTGDASWRRVTKRATVLRSD